MNNRNLPTVKKSNYPALNGMNAGMNGLFGWIRKHKKRIVATITGFVTGGVVGALVGYIGASALEEGNWVSDSRIGQFISNNIGLVSLRSPQVITTGNNWDTKKYDIDFSSAFISEYQEQIMDKWVEDKFTRFYINTIKALDEEILNKTSIQTSVGDENAVINKINYSRKLIAVFRAWQQHTTTFLPTGWTLEMLTLRNEFLDGELKTLDDSIEAYLLSKNVTNAGSVVQINAKETTFTPFMVFNWNAKTSTVPASYRKIDTTAITTDLTSEPIEIPAEDKEKIKEIVEKTDTEVVTTTPSTSNSSSTASMLKIIVMAGSLGYLAKKLVGKKSSK